MKINEPKSLDLQKLHLHCSTVEYIKVMPAMLFIFSEISIYAYEGGEIATHGVKRKGCYPSTSYCNMLHHSGVWVLSL